VKDLIFIDPEDEIPLRSFLTVFSRPLPSVWPDQKLDEV
jgi:metal transporter CNNM